MKIKQLKEKTAQGLKDFLPKIGVGDIEGLLDTLNDKLSKSQGGEIKKPIVITNNNSNYSITINPDGNVFIYNKHYSRNIFNIRPYDENATDVIIDGNRHNASLSIDDIVKLISKRGEIYNSNDIFTASKFKLRNGSNNQVLLGDGTTTSKLVSYISTSPQFDAYIVNILNIDGAHDSFTILGATKELAGLMTATDKAKLDDIPNTYLPLTGGVMKGTLYVPYISPSSQAGLTITGVTGIEHNDQNKFTTPEVWTTDGNSIPIDKAGGVPRLNSNSKIGENQIDELRGYISTLSGRIHTSYNEYSNIGYLSVGGDSNIKGSAGAITIERTDEVDGDLSSDTIITLDGETGSIEAINGTFTDKVKANGFSANNNGNSNTAWTTNGGSIDLINLLSNAAIYVAGGREETGQSRINYTTVIDNPDNIIFDLRMKMFLARKDLVYYSHWNADISKNIAPPSRYGIETDNGVFPFNNQMYKFSNCNDIYIATCSNGICIMKKLTLK